MSGLNLLVKGEAREFVPGVYDNMPRAEYDAIPALNCSTLKRWIDIVVLNGGCQKKFGHWLKNRTEEGKSDALLLGSAVDCMLLEPDTFTEKFIVIPGDAPKRPTEDQLAARAAGSTRQKPETVHAISWWEEFEKNAVGKDILTDALHQKAKDCMGALSTAPLTSDIFQYCRKTTFLAEMLGMPCRGEIDLFSDKTEFIFDLKTAADASLKPFAKRAWELGYHYQAAFYLKLAQALGMEHKKAFCFVVVETAPPFCVAAYTIDFTTEALQYAWKMIQQASHSLMYHLKRNEWPDFGDFTPLKFAGWTRKEALDFLEDAA